MTPKAVLILEKTGQPQGNSLMAAAARTLHGDANFSAGSMEETFLVQYNPTTLKFQGNAANTEESQGNRGNQIPSTGALSLSVDLLYHALAPGDASVFSTMENMMHTIRASATKAVKFAWGSMQVEGELTGFSSHYDMFDPFGTPLSASISLSIRVKTKTATVEKRMEEMAKNQDGEMTHV